MADELNMAAINEAIEVLNRVHAADPSVLPTLIALRVPCNEAVADDPSVQVGTTEHGGFEVGVLGIINGIFGVNARNAGYIAAVYAGHKLMRFEWNGVKGE